MHKMPSKSALFILAIIIFFTCALAQTIYITGSLETVPTLTNEDISPTPSLSSSISTSIGSVSQSQPLIVRLQRSPVYAYPGIIVDFLITPAEWRTQQQLEDMIWFETSDPKYLPPKAYISQGEEPQQVRVVFDYHNNIPYQPFVMVFKILYKAKPQLGQKRIALVFDSISGGITSALHMDYKREDIIR